MENGKNRYLLFEGRLTNTEGHIDVPRGEKFGGTHHDAPPCTLNGFIACRSDEILPEFKIPYQKEKYPTHGSTIWVIEDGVKRKAAIFNDEKMRFMPFDKELNK